MARKEFQLHKKVISKLYRASSRSSHCTPIFPSKLFKFPQHHRRSCHRHTFHCCFTFDLSNQTLSIDLKYITFYCRDDSTPFKVLTSIERRAIHFRRQPHGATLTLHSCNFKTTFDSWSDNRCSNLITCISIIPNEITPLITDSDMNMLISYNKRHEHRVIHRTQNWIKTSFSHSPFC